MNPFPFIACCNAVYDTHLILEQTQWPGVGAYDEVIQHFFEENLRKNSLISPSEGQMRRCLDLFSDALECDEASDVQVLVSEQCLNDIIDLIVLSQWRIP